MQNIPKSFAIRVWVSLGAVARTRNWYALSLRLRIIHHSLSKYTSFVLIFYDKIIIFTTLQYIITPIPEH
jgi:hypothetical protein